MEVMVKYKTWAVLCIVFLLLVTIDCWILRLSCLHDEDRLPFTVNMEEQALENHVIKTMTNISMKDCENECYKEFACKSINWSSENICELNQELKETQPSSLKGKLGWTYRSTNYQTKTIGRVCQELNPCQDQTFCIDTCFHPGYKCIQCPKYHQLRYEQYCQLKAFVNRFYELTNIAYGKTTWGSSKHDHHDSSRANNADETCTTQFISGNHKNNYWTVDLGRKAVVLIVTVMATKPDNEQGTSVTIKVGDDHEHNGNRNPHCVHNQPLPYKIMKNFTCIDENEGRYVTLHQHSGHHRHFRLCYAKVFGIYL